MTFKPCLIPTCTNNSKNAPNKLFISVPTNPDRRKKWYETLNLDPTKGLARTYVCEDHFNLEEDVNNWMYFKTLGKSLILKRDVVPHLNLQTRTTPLSGSSQLTASEKNMKQSWLKLFGHTGNDATLSSNSDQLLAEAVTNVYLNNFPSSVPFPPPTSTKYGKKRVVKNGTQRYTQTNRKRFRLVEVEAATMNDIPSSLSPQTSTKRKQLDKRKCAVENCTSTGAEGRPGLKFHFFPRANLHYVEWKNDSGEVEEIDKAEAWKIATNVKTVTPRRTMICSLHFKKEDYLWIIGKEGTTKNKVLKKDTVPSCNLPIGDLQPYRCRHQCQFTTSLKVALLKHEQFDHNPGHGSSTGSNAIRLPTFTCLSCQKCTTFSAVVMSKHDCYVEGSETSHSMFLKRPDCVEW